MSLQVIVDNAVSIEFIRTKLVGQSISRSGAVKISQVANNVPWRMTIDPRPGMQYANFRYLTEEIDRLDRVIVSTIDIGKTNPGLAYLTQYQGQLSNADLANITVTSAANLSIIMNVSNVSVANTTVVFAAGDFVQPGNNHRYPYTVTSTVLRGDSSTITVPINRPFIEQPDYTAAGANVRVGVDVTWDMVMSRKPSHRVVPGGYLEWADVFELVEVIDLVNPSPSPPPPPPPPPAPMQGVVALHGFGAPDVTGSGDPWRVDESLNNANIIATGTSAGRYPATTDATEYTVGDTGLKYGTGSFGRLLTGAASVGNIAHSNNFIFSGAFTVECWANMQSSSSFDGGLISKWGYGAGNVTGNSWIMYMAQDTDLVTALLSLDGSNTALTLTSNITRTPDTWQHFALERNNSNVVRLYIDGAVVAQGTLSGALYNNDPNPLIYGAGPTYLFSVAAGWRIDDARITNGVAQYNGAFTPPTQPHARPNSNAVSVNTTNTFIATANANGTLTTSNVTYTATGGDGTGTTYGYIYRHTLNLGATTGPVLTLSSNSSNIINVSATGNIGDNAAGNVTTITFDPTGFSSTVVRTVSLTWV